MQTGMFGFSMRWLLYADFWAKHRRRGISIGLANVVLANKQTRNGLPRSQGEICKVLPCVSLNGSQI